MLAANVNPFGIDFVILWVDGSDPTFVSRHAEALADERAQGVAIEDSPNRHRDSGELLFLLRSIEENMPWYRRIYVVTNGQRPAYVDFASDRIRLVTHDQIFPKGVRTPSFNTFAIESCVHEIDGLSETFVRFSDDFFVGAPVARQQFLGPDGWGHPLFGEAVFNVDRHQYHQQLENAALKFREKFGFLPLMNHVHAPQLRRRSVMYDLVNAWPDWYAATRASRFRSASDANSFFLYPYFALYHHRRADLVKFLREGDAPAITNVYHPSHAKQRFFAWVLAGGKTEWRQKLKKVVADQPRFFNINDDMAARPNPADIAFVGEQLRRMFPKPSPYENPAAPPPPYAAERPEGRR